MSFGGKIKNKNRNNKIYMEKLNMQTTDVVDENIKRIGEMFPNCLTEVKDEKGRPQVAIDFDQLRQRIMGSHPRLSIGYAVSEIG